MIRKLMKYPLSFFCCSSLMVLGLSAFPVSAQIAPDGKLGSFFLSDAMGTGDGGNVTISTGRYSIQTAGLSTARTLTAARGGNITLNAESLMLKRPVGSISQGIFTSTVGSATGQGGNLTIETQRLQHEFGALNASTQSLGSGGNLTINANAIELIGVPSNLPGNTNIGASSEGVGPAGNLTINTAQLAVRNGAFVSSSAYSEGNGGSVTVNATESIEVTGSRQDPIVGFRPSLITSSGILLPQNIRPILGFPDRVTGAAGGVIINTPRLVVSDGGEVSVRHDSEGNAGSLQINADTIALDRNGRLSAATASGKGEILMCRQTC
jgi:large exoprotein involved in heme utilization and adhesion